MTELTVRGPRNFHVFVRLADEGVPVAVIARAYRCPFSEISDVLRDAVTGGQLLALPEADWPAGSRREARAPSVAPLRQSEDLVGMLMIAFQLTKTEARAVAALMRRPEMTKNSLHITLSDNDTPMTEPKIVDVIICKARKKLTPHGIEIRTVWGRGYTMPRESIQRAMYIIQGVEDDGE